MKTIILALATVTALGALPAFADGGGGTTGGYERWQSANGNPTIPSTEWFAMNPTQRRTRVAQLQQQQAAAIWGPAPTNSVRIAGIPFGDFRP